MFCGRTSRHENDEMRVRLHEHKWLIEEIVNAALDRARTVASPHFFSTEDKADLVKKEVRGAVTEAFKEFRVKSDSHGNNESLYSGLAGTIQIDFWPRKHFVRKQVEQLSFWSVPRVRVVSCGTFNISPGHLNAALQANDLTAEGDEAQAMAEIMRMK